MPTVTTGDGVEIYYKDWGSGQPVVFSHGWPLTADAWDGSANFVASRGFRAVAHDRRGGGGPASHGRATTWTTTPTIWPL
jgi:non-heme chloroperoxidase